MLLHSGLGGSRSGGQLSLGLLLVAERHHLLDGEIGDFAILMPTTPSDFNLYHGSLPSLTSDVSAHSATNT